MSHEFTIVLGVDGAHINQLQWAWRSWILNKPSLFKHPIIIFFDSMALYPFVSALESPPFPCQITKVLWDRAFEPPKDSSRWYEPQRVKMLSGFVFVPARHVETEYWLKLDLDTVAIGQDDWIDDNWFDAAPGIVAHPWGYTKPADQMQQLDTWAEYAHVFDELSVVGPLNLIPNVGSTMVRHHRIISWCGFFETQFTQTAAKMAERTIGKDRLPVPSQDGYLWYVAKRLGLIVVRANMKSRGWGHLSTTRGVRNLVKGMLEEDHETKNT